jgi:hypothetical protein
VNGYFDKEIQNTIKQLLRQKFNTFIDIGSAEGYNYIVSAKYGNWEQVYSYEWSEEACKLQDVLAERNEVKSKLRVLGACNCKD